MSRGINLFFCSGEQPIFELGKSISFFWGEVVFIILCFFLWIAFFVFYCVNPFFIYYVFFSFHYILLFLLWKQGVVFWNQGEQAPGNTLHFVLIGQGPKSQSFFLLMVGSQVVLHYCLGSANFCFSHLMEEIKTTILFVRMTDCMKSYESRRGYS